MEVKIDITPNENDKEKKMSRESSPLAYATVNFEGDFVLDNVTVNKKRNGELYVKMPQINSRKKDGGVVRIEQNDAFYCKDKRVREQLNNSIIYAYQHGSGIYGIDSVIYIPQEVKVHEITNRGATVGSASVDFGDFVLPSVYIQKTSTGGLKLSNTATLRDVVDKETGETKEVYKDNFKPINSDSGKMFYDSVITAFNEVTQSNSVSKDNSIEGKGR